ncbi:sugar transferase [Novosphingobium aquimarinum]|uniref:sugar transferase n=1 Tax=Novosphingobium aquimarinum TaxID=2682494 RepID=UPI0012EBB859|nr:sugar transferase [Novosphingobium aquimarinum]
MFSCDLQAVPLPLAYRRSFYPRVVKPAVGAAIAVVMLTLLAPLMVAIALLIKLDDGGPVFFRQKRTGYLGRRFGMFKFRTMVPDAEAMKERLRQLNQHGADAIDFKIKDDPRITRMGRFLRKTSLDELPNLFNVVIGDMALVGPRPTSFHPQEYRENHLPRLAVKPGITGLWQVSGRANIDFDARSALDIRYVRWQSLGTDVTLLLRTVRAVLKGNGAY